MCTGICTTQTKKHCELASSVDPAGAVLSELYSGNTTVNGYYILYCTDCHAVAGKDDVVSIR